MDKMKLDDFSKVDLRVGLITSVQEHPNADKLFVLKVDLGEDEERTIVAGLRGHYSAEELKGKKAIFVANLESVKLRGIESNGVILAVNGTENDIVILVPNGDAEIGSRVR